jgi:hypothetical protein
MHLIDKICIYPICLISFAKLDLVKNNKPDANNQLILFR